MRAWVATKVPFEHVEDVAMEALVSIVDSSYEGKTIGELFGWMRTITSRRIADFHDKRNRTISTEPLPDGGDAEEGGIFGVEPGEESGEDARLTRAVAYRVLERLQPLHQAVIRAYGPGELGFVDLGAAEAAAAVEALHPGSAMTAANVHQIWKRFKDALEDELGMRS